MKPVLVCQIGAREQYAVARSIAKEERLLGLCTDIWTEPDTYWGRVKSISQRWHPALKTQHIYKANFIFVSLEVVFRVFRVSGHKRVLVRNFFFQLFCCLTILSLVARRRDFTLYAFNYAALLPIRLASWFGRPTILNVIDGGLKEQWIVQRISGERPSFSLKTVCGGLYWRGWIGELTVADRIVVNSKWSQSLLPKKTLKEKSIIVPLAVESGPERTFKDYPLSFSHERPMQILFLGQINPRKGLNQLLIAIRELRSHPVVWIFVGSADSHYQAKLKMEPSIKFIGQVPHSNVSDYYANADIFIFPTCSDGFGLTQLEAQAFGLPVIASLYCGEVVQVGVNGWLLSEVTSIEIVKSVCLALESTETLYAMSANAFKNAKRFDMQYLSQHLLAVLK